MWRCKGFRILKIFPSLLGGRLVVDAQMIGKAFEGDNAMASGQDGKRCGSLQRVGIAEPRQIWCPVHVETAQRLAKLRTVTHSTYIMSSVTTPAPDGF